MLSVVGAGVVMLVMFGVLVLVLALAMVVVGANRGRIVLFSLVVTAIPVSYTHLTLPTTPYV